MPRSADAGVRGLELDAGCVLLVLATNLMLPWESSRAARLAVPFETVSILLAFAGILLKVLRRFSLLQHACRDATAARGQLSLQKEALRKRPKHLNQTLSDVGPIDCVPRCMPLPPIPCTCALLGPMWHHTTQLPLLPTLRCTGEPNRVRDHHAPPSA